MLEIAIALHPEFIKRIEQRLERHLGEQMLVRLPDPIRLDDCSEPEPDIAVVLPPADFYASLIPPPAASL